MARGRRVKTRRDLPDEMPRSAIADGPLAIDGRTVGRGGPRLMLFAVVGLLALFGVVGALWAASHFSRHGSLEKPASELTTATALPGNKR